MLARALDVHGGALQHPPEGDRLARLEVLPLGDALEVLVDVALDVLEELVDVDPGRLEDLQAFEVAAQREQEVLERDVLVATSASLVERGFKGCAKLVGDVHEGEGRLLSRSSPSSAGSIVTSRGYCAFSAAAMASETLVSATEKG